MVRTSARCAEGHRLSIPIGYSDFFFVPAGCIMHMTSFVITTLVVTKEMDNFEFAKTVSGNSLTFSSLNMNVTKPV